MTAQDLTSFVAGLGEPFLIILVPKELFNYGTNWLMRDHSGELSGEGQTKQVQFLCYGFS